MRDTQGVSDDRQRWVNGRGRDEAGCVNEIKIMKLMGFAVRVQDRSCGVCSHAAGTVLVPDAFERNAFLEVGMQRDVGVSMTGLLEGVDPAIL